MVLQTTQKSQCVDQSITRSYVCNSRNTLDTINYISIFVCLTSNLKKFVTH